jgi:hypothetical protein
VPQEIPRPEHPDGNQPKRKRLGPQFPHSGLEGLSMLYAADIVDLIEGSRIQPEQKVSALDFMRGQALNSFDWRRLLQAQRFD